MKKSVRQMSFVMITAIIFFIVFLLLTGSIVKIGMGKSSKQSINSAVFLVQIVISFYLTVISEFKIIRKLNQFSNR